MKTVSMSGSLRESVGKKDAKKNRREGKVPCVLYGGKEQLHFSVAEADFKKIIFTAEVYLINLNIGGKEYDAVLQDIQYHPVSDRILHADFLETIPGKPIIISIPVHIEGVAPGILKGGKLHKKIRKLKVKGLPEYLPNHLTLSIDDLDIGDSIKVKDVKYEHLEFLDTATSVVISVKTARGATAEELEEDAAAAAAASAAGAVAAGAVAAAAESKAEEKKE